MSVTFSVDSPIIGWRATCSCRQVSGENLYENPQDVDKAVDSGQECLECDICSDYGDRPRATPVELFDDAPTFNVSNSNAASLLVMLGLHSSESDLVGSCPGFQLASLAAQARVERAEVAYAAPALGGFREADCSAEYVEDRLVDLQALGEYAWDRGRAVLWA